MAEKKRVTMTFEIEPALLRKIDRRLAGLRTAGGYKVTKRQFFETAIQSALGCPILIKEMTEQPFNTKAYQNEGPA